ncbi:MAG: hypothetical protein CVV21_04910 [Candidatus Goldiibacteriota bacterium HGW-Goldbacteria-1]|jgi:hypothetical protein|nr:MAG: hypothetical protein CVV21_04910 [Candidatus Goldiibacteriota bacterium HGW-Goldbacteria-1]
MRKLFVLTVIALAFASASFAAFNISVSGGYSYSSMESMNSYWETIKTDAAAYTTTSNANWKGYGNGIFGNVDLSVNLDTNIMAGIRTGVQYIFPSTYTGYRLINVPPLTWMYTETSIANYLIPVMAGLNFYMPLGTESAVALSAGVYAGWGLAYCEQTTSYNNSPDVRTLYGANGFVADLSAKAEMKILPFLSVSLNGGYRFAKMTSFKNVESVSAEVPGYGLYVIPSDDPFSDNEGKPVEVDFSGINIGVGVNLIF